LILVMDQSNHGTRWQDFPGLAVRPISARRRTRTLRILPSIFSSGGEIQLPADSKYRLEIKTNNTHVLAETTGDHLEKTLQHLNHIRNRVGDSPQEHQRNVQDLLTAAEELNRMDTQSTEPYQIQIAQLLRHFTAKQFNFPDRR